jgi:hypothetical protein
VRGKTQAEDTILSITPSKEALIVREATLRKGGFKVISVISPVQARFEIEMGRCGTLLFVPIVCQKQIQAKWLACSDDYCTEGRIVFVTDVPRPERVPVDADIAVPESSGPEVFFVLIVFSYDPADLTANARHTRG